MDFNNYIEEIKKLRFYEKLIESAKYDNDNDNKTTYFMIFSFFIFFYFQTIISHSFFDFFHSISNVIEYKRGLDLLLHPIKSNSILILNHLNELKEPISQYINDTFINIFIFSSFCLIFEFVINTYKSKKIEIKKFIKSITFYTCLIISLYLTSVFFLSDEFLIKSFLIFEITLYVLLMMSILIVVIELIGNIYSRCLSFYLSFRNINNKYIEEKNKNLDNIINSLLKNDTEMLNIIYYHYNKKKMVEDFKEKDLNLINDELLKIIEIYKKNIGGFKTEEEILKDSILNKNKNENDVFIINE